MQHNLAYAVQDQFFIDIHIAVSTETNAHVANSNTTGAKRSTDPNIGTQLTIALNLFS